MPLTTISAAAHISPVVIKTFCRHYVRKLKKCTSHRPDEATDDILFDEAFHIVKAFINLATYNTVESLQIFTNTHIPAPPWAAVVPVLVPLSSCNNAADALIDWFGSDEMKKVVGGDRWWQVRGLDGVEAEWVTQKKFLGLNSVSGAIRKASKALNDEKSGDSIIRKMNQLTNVMFYIHGGAYYWGSINTHRYQLIRYARKIEGRVFAVNYRKAPQYPWPCALQDVLAAYLYLINPPEESQHAAIPNTQIVMAGDSAGAGLCLTVLTVIRDLGIPMPAGAVLISPWVDMTHSFPSLMENRNTDISPPHGFINKPSPVWPVNPISSGRDRIIETETLPPPEPGRPDTLKPDKERVGKNSCNKRNNNSQSDALFPATVQRDSSKSKLSQECSAYGETTEIMPVNDSERSDDSSLTLKFTATLNRGPDGESSDVDPNYSIESNADGWRPKPPKVVMENPKETPLELRAQIQHYATNEQLIHPLVSPILQGSLGNLCPLYIIAGDKEALRDEVIYLAHRAARPEKYPPRKSSLKDFSRQEENYKKFVSPTPVHLDVFDGMCHVLTVFTFTPSAKYAYRAIAEFTKHVINQPENYTSKPFPEISKYSSNTSLDSEADEIFNVPGEDTMPQTLSHSNTRSDRKYSSRSSGPIPEEILSSNDIITVIEPNREHPIAKASGNSLQKNPFHKHEEQTILIRQRVDVHGHTRQMEPEENIYILQISPDDIGLIREAPARRWLSGQSYFDKKFRVAASKIIRKRIKYEMKYENVLQRMKDHGFVHESDLLKDVSTFAGVNIANERDVIQKDRRWGPLDLTQENPPPTAIAKRRDTPDALALLRKTIYHSAPVTTKFVPQRGRTNIVKAIFDPEDNPSGPPQQSASEQQRLAESGPMHGLKIWASLMTVFVKQSSKKTKAARKKKYIRT